MRNNFTILREKDLRTCVKVFLAASFVLVFVFFDRVHRAEAATLYFSPATGSYTVGKSFPVSVIVSSPDRAMNAAAGVVLFPKDKLEVASISKTGSIMSLWVQEPSFSNAAGTVNLEGIVLNPGFTGAVGKVLIINFRAKQAGTAAISFSSGSVLANDGNGTNILNGLGTATFTLSSEIYQAGAPDAPRVTSPTHPDHDIWYSNNNPQFEWPLASDIAGVNILTDRNQSTNPGTNSDGLFSSYNYKNIEDGSWFFHIRLKNGIGWGDVAHFGFNVDTEKPEHFEIQETWRESLANPKVSFTFDAKDKTSGIDHYEVQLDDEKSNIWKDDGTHVYTVTVKNPGKHELVAKAVDRAGNFLASIADFSVEALEAPKITEYPHELKSGETLIVKGTTYPNIEVLVWLQRGKEDPIVETVRSGGDGTFTFVASKRPENGIYMLWAQAVDSGGAKSNPSEKVTISVEQSAFFQLGSWLIAFLTILISLIALIILIIIMLWYASHKLSQFKERLKREVKGTEKDIHKAFDVLREGIRVQVKLLEKAKTARQLTEEEEKVIKRLKRDLDQAEQFVENKIEALEKEVE
ncbi:MAG: hypothetical protein A3J67_00160 [Parcubacteria group bacterium RIFCSPHIGHO2_02_FULL_48_10b]|nr:MAG: hypothetical protein A3J67_00160 [Parcubacteria group bacterium RIFCSPHIGHO2_02_FULL_48_10b]